MTNKPSVVPVPVADFCFQGYDMAQCGSDALLHFMKELQLLSHFAYLLE